MNLHQQPVLFFRPTFIRRKCKKKHFRLLLMNNSFKMCLVSSLLLCFRCCKRQCWGNETHEVFVVASKKIAMRKSSKQSNIASDLGTWAPYWMFISFLVCCTTAILSICSLGKSAFTVALRWFMVEKNTATQFNSRIDNDDLVYHIPSSHCLYAKVGQNCRHLFTRGKNNKDAVWRPEENFLSL